jgi:hypothetical protein
MRLPRLLPKPLFSAPLVSIGMLLAQSPALAAPACVLHSAATTVPLVELYTSEGCSSCPPADRWFSAHANDPAANWLAFHVDYWDAIGWHDRFGSPLFSQRQRSRVAAVGESTVYTPQVMVGQQAHASWHNGLRTELRKARGPAKASLALQLHPIADGWQASLGAARIGTTSGEASVWMAQYSDDQDTDVRAGENQGVHLHHDRVVRHLWGPWPLGVAALSQQVSLHAPSPQWGLTAFVQDARGRVWQSLNVPAAQDCPPG